MLKKMKQEAWEEWHSDQDYKDNIPSAINPCFSAGYHAGIKELGFDVLSLTEELRRAEDLHPEWPTDLIHQIAIMSEEAGEVVQAANNLIMHKEGSIEDVRNELVQTGSMVLRCLKNLEAGVGT